MVDFATLNFFSDVRNTNFILVYCNDLFHYCYSKIFSNTIFINSVSYEPYQLNI